MYRSFLAAGVMVLGLSTGSAAAPVSAAIRGDGEVSGKVTDAAEGTALSGAQLTVEGTKLGASSDKEGAYKITSIPEGTYILRVVRIGYKSMTQDLTIGSGTTETVDFAMEDLPTKLEEKVVTGNMSNATVKTMPTSISIITADQIEQRGYASVADIFKADVPGVTIQTNPQYNYYAYINIRGATTLGGYGTAQILIDGVEMADPYYIMNLDPAMIERVEVLRGPMASTTYGSAAAGGVIAFYTKKGHYAVKPQFEAKVGGGHRKSETQSAYDSDNNASILGGGKDWSYRVGGQYQTTGEWLEDTDGKMYGGNGTVRGKHKAFEIEMNLRYSYLSAGAGRNTGFEERFASIYEGDESFRYEIVSYHNITKQEGYGAHLLYQATPGWKHELTLALDKNDFGFDFPYNKPYYWYTSYGSYYEYYYLYTYESVQTTTKYMTGWDFSAGKFTSQLQAGAEYNPYRNVNTSISGPNLGNLYEDGYFYPDQEFVDNLGYYSFGDFHTKDGGAFAQEVIGYNDRLYLTLGLRGDVHKELSQNATDIWSPRAGLANNFTVGANAVRLKTAYGKTPRGIPYYATRDQSSAFSRQIGNPNIKAPNLNGFDVGFDLAVGRRYALGVTYYNQNLSDEVVYYFIPTSDGLYTYSYDNLGEVQNKGWEVEARVELTTALSLSGVYSPVKTRITRLDAPVANYQVGDRLVDTPNYTASLTALLQLPKSSIMVQGLFTGTKYNIDYIAYYTEYEVWYEEYQKWLNGEIPDYPPFVDYYAFFGDYEPYMRVNTSASHYLSRRLQLYFTANNLLDDYTPETINIYAVQGRSMTFGIRLKP